MARPGAVTVPEHEPIPEREDELEDIQSRQITVDECSDWYIITEVAHKHYGQSLQYATWRWNLCSRPLLWHTTA